MSCGSFSRILLISGEVPIPVDQMHRPYGMCWVSLVSVLGHKKSMKMKVSIMMGTSGELGDERAYPLNDHITGLDRDHARLRSDVNVGILEVRRGV
jgi:hypothetical protein